MVNNTVYQGRLTRDVEIRYTQSGIEVASFTVAWSEKYNDRETKCFLDCTAWRNTAKFVSQYFKKGQEIVVEGKLQTETWQDKDGNNRSSIKLTVDKAHFCGPKQGNGVNSNTYNSSGGGIDVPYSDTDFSELSEDDNELPF